MCLSPAECPDGKADRFKFTELPDLPDSLHVVSWLKKHGVSADGCACMCVCCLRKIYASQCGLSVLVRVDSRADRHFYWGWHWRAPQVVTSPARAPYERESAHSKLTKQERREREADRIPGS